MADVIQTLPNTKADLVAAAVQKNLIEKSVLAATVSNFSNYAVKGAKSVRIPTLTNFTVTNRTLGSAVDAGALTDAYDQIDFNFHAYIAYLYDSRDAFQSSIDYQIEAALRASAAHAKYVDQQVLSTLLSGAVGTVSVATFTTVKDQALELRRLVLQAGGDLGKVFLACSLDKEAEMLKEADFVRADYMGSANVRSGQIGQIYGMPVILSRVMVGVGANSMVCYDMDGIGLAFQGGVQMSEQMANQYGANSMRVAIDQTFGVAALNGAGTTSSLIAKLVA